MQLHDQYHKGKGATMFDLDQVIEERHSARMFLPVPRGLVDEALAQAVREEGCA